MRASAASEVSEWFSSGRAPIAIQAVLILRACAPTPDSRGGLSHRCGPSTEAQWKAALSISTRSDEQTASMIQRKAKSDVGPAGTFEEGRSRGSFPRALSNISGANETDR